jgi:hypothetical protein
MNVFRRAWFKTAGRFTLLALLAAAGWMGWRPPGDVQLPEPKLASLARVPVVFEQNVGQHDSHILFRTPGVGPSLQLTRRGEAVFALSERINLPGSRGQASRIAKKAHPRTAQPSALAVRIGLVGGNPAPSAKGLNPLPGKSNYFVGQDPSQWRTFIPHFERVRFREIYPGVDMVYYGKNQQLEFDFEVAAGADPRAIRLTVSGARKLELNVLGNLVIRTGQGPLVLHRPIAYQPGNGARKEVEAEFMLHDEAEFSFRVGAYDTGKPLVIDPVLSYSTLFNASPTAIAADSSGNTYLTGWSSSLPATPGSFQNSASGLADAFVAKLDPSGATLLFATYLGGAENDFGQSIQVDNAGNVYIAGQTQSSNLPLAGAFQTALLGESDAFLAKFSADGSQLLYATYYGGTGDDMAQALAVDSSGRAYVTGWTSSVNFPTSAGAFQSMGGGPSAFAAKFDPTSSGSASRVYATYLGGNADDYGYGIAVDSSGAAYVCGLAHSTNFPIVNAFQATCRDCATGGDAFVLKLNPAGTALAYSTFLGGVGSDRALAIQVDSSGHAFVAGYTAAATFPVTPGAFQTAKKNGSDGFVAKLAPNGSSLVYSTFLGGSEDDSVNALALDAAGNAFLAGQTYSPDFPLKDPLQRQFGGGDCGYDGWYYHYFIPCSDVAVPQMNAAGSALLFSTFIGASDAAEMGFGIALDASDNAYVTGGAAPGFPVTPGALQTTSGFGFVLKISPLNAPGIGFNTTSLFFAEQGTGTTSPAQQFVLHNMGSAALDISSITSSSGQFAQTNTCGSGVAAGSNCTIDVTFTPSTRGAILGAIVIDHSAGGSPHQVSLSGTGAGNGAPSFSSNRVVFPDQLAGTSASLPLTLTNSGTEDLALTQIVVIGPFTQTNNCSATLAPAAACDFQITFSPPSTGMHQGTLSLSHDAVGSPVSVPMEGRGVSGGAVTLSQSNLNFGSQLVDTTSAALSADLTNTGSGPLTLTGISLESVFGVGFTFLNTAANRCQNDMTLAVGASCSLTLSFKPRFPGAHSDAVLVSHDGPGSPRGVALSGSGTDFVLDPPAVAMATVTAGQTATFRIPVSSVNGFSGSVAFACVNSVPLSSCTITPTSLTLNGGGTASVDVNVTTTGNSTFLPIRQDGERWPRILITAWALLFVLSALALCKTRRAPRWARASCVLVVLLVLAGIAAGCGGGGDSPKPRTPPGTFTVTVSGSSSGVARAVDLKVNVR